MSPRCHTVRDVEAAFTRMVREGQKAGVDGFAQPCRIRLQAANQSAGIPYSLFEVGPRGERMGLPGTADPVLGMTAREACSSLNAMTRAFEMVIWTNARRRMGVPPAGPKRAESLKDEPVPSRFSNPSRRPGIHELAARISDIRSDHE